MGDVAEIDVVDVVGADLHGPGVEASCGGIAALVLGCLGGVICQIIYFSLPYIGSVSSPGRGGMTGIPGFLYGMGSFVIGAFSFVLAVLFISALALASHISGSAWRGFCWATGVGSILYWYAFWCMWVWALGIILSISDLMREAGGDLLPTIGAIGTGIGVGVAMALVSALPLAGLQWLALRRFLPKVVRWIATVVVGNAIVTGVFISLYLWGLRWGWN